MAATALVMVTRQPGWAIVLRREIERKKPHVNASATAAAVPPEKPTERPPKNSACTTQKNTGPQGCGNPDCRLLNRQPRLTLRNRNEPVSKRGDFIQISAEKPSTQKRPCGS